MSKNEAEPRRRLSLTVQYACQVEGLPSRSTLRRWLRAAQVSPATVTVRFVDAGESRRLNRAYRGKDAATNILSFGYAPPPQMAGDLVLCVPVALAEAESQGKSMRAHIAHLLVHGMLHLQGHDHESDAEAASMEAKEREVLAGLGYPDPYNPIIDDLAGTA